ncbi:MAG: hypothetical protein HND41_10950, partial [Chlorobi bacterium]|nr:hypothetical protein [Chlorobiota bacterium]
LLYHHAQAPYPMRALEEIIGEIDAATKKNDAAALQRLADELEGGSEPAAIALWYFAGEHRQPYAQGRRCVRR